MKEKVKRFFVKIFPILNVISPTVDLALCFYLQEAFKDEKGIIQLIPLVLFGLVLWHLGKGLYLCFRSVGDANVYLNNNRVIPIDGKQGSGKTSLAGYFSYLYKKNIYSNTPLKVRGKYVNILTDDVLSLKTKVPENSLLVIDECNMFYNATFGDGTYDKKKGYNEGLFAQSIFGQCVRHFTDGNIIYCSVDTERLPKIIRDVFSCRLQTLKQESYEICFIGSAIIKIIYSLLGISCHTGVRVWTVKHYEKILDDNYVGVLTDDKNEFAPTIKFACLQSLTSFEYDDRYMRAFYQLLPDEKEAFYTSLSLLDAKEEMMKDTEVYKLFDERTNHFKKQ